MTERQTGTGAGASLRQIQARVSRRNGPTVCASVAGEFHDILTVPRAEGDVGFAARRRAPATAFRFANSIEVVERADLPRRGAAAIAEPSGRGSAALFPLRISQQRRPMTRFTGSHHLAAGPADVEVARSALSAKSRPRMSSSLVALGSPSHP